MSEKFLACVRLAQSDLDLVEINRLFRWSSVRRLASVRIPVSGRYVQRDVLVVGDSHGAYNGCLGPPPKVLKRLGKRQANAREQRVTELYISGMRLGREEVDGFLELMCADTGCTFALLENAEAVESDLRSALKNAPVISLTDAEREWPYLVRDDQTQISIVSSDVVTK